MLEIIWKKKGTILSIMLAFLLLAFIFSVFQPVSYSAKSKILVIQNAPAGSDPYALSRSNAYLGAVLSEVVLTYSFYDEVMKGGFEIDKSYFEKNGVSDKTLERWQKTVKAVSLGDTGAIEISVVHPEKDQARKIAEGVFSTLSKKHQNFHGSGDGVRINVVDPAIVSQRTPDVKLNFAGAIFLGGCLSLFFILQFVKKEDDLNSAE